jgi:hypothetical protein
LPAKCLVYRQMRFKIHNFFSSGKDKVQEPWQKWPARCLLFLKIIGEDWLLFCP